MVTWRYEGESAGFEITYPERLLENPTGSLWNHLETASVSAWNVHGRFQFSGELVFGEPDEILSFLKKAESGKAIADGFVATEYWLKISTLEGVGRTANLQFDVFTIDDRIKARLTIPVDSGLLRKLTMQWHEAMKKN